MMTAYILRLVVLLVLVSGLAVLALWLWRKVQPGMSSFGQRERAVKVIDAVPVGALSRLAVIEFSGKRLLIAITRGRVDLLSEGPIPLEGPDVEE